MGKSITEPPRRKGKNQSCCLVQT